MGKTLTCRDCVHFWGYESSKACPIFCIEDISECKNFTLTERQEKVKKTPTCEDCAHFWENYEPERTCIPVSVWTDDLECESFTPMAEGEKAKEMARAPRTPGDAWWRGGRVETKKTSHWWEYVRLWKDAIVRTFNKKYTSMDPPPPYEKKREKTINVYDSFEIMAKVNYNEDLDHRDRSDLSCKDEGRHKGLARLKDGRFVLIRGTDWGGEYDSTEIISDKKALFEILLSENYRLIKKFGLHELKKRVFSGRKEEEW